MSDLLNELEMRLRRIIREEVANAITLSEDKTENIPDIEDDLTESEINQQVFSAKKSFPNLLTAPEVAELLKVKVQRVYELARRSKENGFPVIKIGERQLRFSKTDVLKWIESKKDL